LSKNVTTAIQQIFYGKFSFGTVFCQTI